MFACVRILRWTPKYYSRIGRKAAAVKKATPHAPSHLNVRQPAMASPHVKAQQAAASPARPVLSSSYYMAQGSSLPAALHEVRERAVVLQREWKETAESGHEGMPYSSRTTRQRLSVDIRQSVLGPLSLCLPQSPQPAVSRGKEREHGAEPQVGGARRSRLRVVPDDFDVTTAGTPPASREPGVAAPLGGAACSTLEDLVLYLDLYHAVEYEDGQLLRQLLGEVRRFLVVNIAQKEAAAASEKQTTPNAPRVVLPLPALLYVLSQLGIAEENMIQVIVRHRPRSSLGPASGKGAAAASLHRTTGGGDNGLLYAQIPHYTVLEHLQLLAALHRFGLQQEYAFEAVMKALRTQSYQSKTPFGAFCKHVRHQRRKQAKAKGDAPEGADDVFLKTRDVSSADDVDGTEYESPLDNALRIPVALLVETLTALSVSIHRRPEIVTFLAHLLSANAREEGLRILNGGATTAGFSQDEVDTALVALGHLVLRAVRLCEGMDELQPQLADTLSWCCTASSRGIVFDGGEDASIASERRVYYDHVTADLVKVGSVRT